MPGGNATAPRRQERTGENDEARRLRHRRAGGGRSRRDRPVAGHRARRRLPPAGPRRPGGPGRLVGGPLSSSGVAFQALLRNPLADPYILGVSAGAAVGALCAALLLPGDAFLPLPFCAFLGAVIAASAVFLLARRRSGVSRERLILMGVIVGAFLNALIMLMVALAPPGRIPGAVYWLMGDLGLGTPRRVGMLLPYAP